MTSEGSPQRRTLCCGCLVRRILGVDLRLYLVALVLFSLVLFAGLGVFMTATMYNGSPNDFEALHVNGNVMAVLFNESIIERIPPTERKTKTALSHLL